jgi:hypothetical protein
MKTTYSPLKTVVTALSALALMFTPVMQARADIGDVQTRTIQVQQRNGSADQALEAAKKQILTAHPGYSIDHISTVTTTVSINATPEEINAAVSKALSEQAGAEVQGGLADPNLALECIVAVVVIVVGTIVIVKLIHLCQKVLPPTPTNNPASDNAVILTKNMTSNASPDVNVYAAWIILGSDDSMQPGGGSGNALDIPFTLSGQNNAVGVLGHPTWATPSAMVSLSVFTSQMQSLGLTFSSTKSSYSSNGIPVPNLPNIQWANGALTIKVGTSVGSVTNVFQRSPSFGPGAVWTPFFTLITLGGPAQTTVTDGNPPAGKAYYRVQISH